MRNDSWLDAFAHELELAGLRALERAEILVETDGFLSDADVGAFEHFGSPVDYAAEIIAAIGGQSQRLVAADAPNVLTVSGVSKRYRRRPVLSDVSCDVPSGGLVVLTGPNGAGKSTLLRIIAGLESRDAGFIDCDGSIGYVPQSGGLDPYLRPSEHFALTGVAAGLAAPAAIREGQRLADELGWDAAAAPRAGELSGGTQQKLSVIIALMGTPSILLLDEPYQGMDAESTHRFWELLWAWQSEGGSTLIASHAPDALRTATSVVEIEGLPTR
ncbi:MAG: ATP-binding cassette domain-containing protein [Acidimicrobiales bacterium]